MNTNHIINLGILAHVDAGKTTVTEGLLVHSGAKRQMGRVDDGTTTTDAMALERQRGLTIRASTVSFSWKGVKVNLIDTPGHMDFIAEVERSLSVLDGVILVISAKEGVQPQTRTIFMKLRAMHIPTIIFINKIDRIGASLERVYRDIREKLTEQIVVMQKVRGEGSREASVEPLRFSDEPLHEAIIAESDALLAKYVAGEMISGEACRQALKQMVERMALCPVFHGAALHDIGIQPLLDAVTQFFSGSGDNAAPLCATIYKVEWDASGRKWLYVRIFNGVLALREKVSVVGREESIQIKALLAMQNGRIMPVDRLTAGDIGVLPDAPSLRCGDFLGSVLKGRTTLAAAPPLMTVAITPRNAAQRPQLLDGLQRLAQEDPFLHLQISKETGEITLQLYGPLQREIIQALVLERFGIEADFSRLMTLFKAQPLVPTEAEIRMNAPGNFLRAGIALMLEPLAQGSGIVYESKVSLGDLEKSFQSAVAEGVRFGLAEGVGYEVVDTKVTFTDMDYCSVTSTPAEFRRLAPQVVKKALEQAGCRKLEPWLAYMAIVPAAFQKKVLRAFQKMQVTMENVVYGDLECTITGEAPFDTIKDFAVELAGMTQGEGIFETSFLAYRSML